MARFFVDEDLPRSLVRELVADGHDAIDARDAGLRGVSDERVHAQALREARALVTADVGLANPSHFQSRSEPEGGVR